MVCIDCKGIYGCYKHIILDDILNLTGKRLSIFRLTETNFMRILLKNDNSEQDYDEKILVNSAEYRFLNLK